MMLKKCFEVSDLGDYVPLITMSAQICSRSGKHTPLSPWATRPSWSENFWYLLVPGATETGTWIPAHDSSKKRN